MIDACVEQTLEGAQLAREPVAGVDARHFGFVRASENRTQCGVFAGKRHGTGPRRQDVDALRERHPDPGPDGVAGAACPACRFKISDERRNLRRVDYRGDLSNRRLRCYLGRGHVAQPFVVLAPGCVNIAGAFNCCGRLTLHAASDGTFHARWRTSRRKREGCRR